jgi:hypothetical protein
MPGKAIITQNYQVYVNTRPARDHLGPIDVITEVGPKGEDKLSIRRRQDGVDYFKLLIADLPPAGPESNYIEMMRGITKKLGLGDEPKSMFFEQYLGKTGLFAIAEHPSTKGISFFYTVCPFARRGLIEGTNMLVASGLPLLATAKMIDSIRIKKLV